MAHGLLLAHPWDSSISSLLHAIALYENSKLSEEETERKELDHFNSLPLTLKTFASHPRLITDVHKYICSRVNVFLFRKKLLYIHEGKKGERPKTKLLLTHLMSKLATTHLCPTGAMMSPELSLGIYRSCHPLPPQQNPTQCPSPFT